jgi:hypothetical protein
VFYVYLIESLSTQGKRYVGVTADLKQRLNEHNTGKSSHTSKFKPSANHLHRIYGPGQGRGVRALSQIRVRPRICQQAPMVVRGVNM